VEHAENDGEPEAEQRVERAVDQAEQELPEQCLRRYAEDLEHAPSAPPGRLLPQAAVLVGSAIQMHEFALDPFRKPISTLDQVRGKLFRDHSLAADQRTAALLEWPECFRRRNGRAQLVVVARISRLLRLLHFEQIGIVQLAPVDAD